MQDKEQEEVSKKPKQHRRKGIGMWHCGHEECQGMNPVKFPSNHRVAHTWPKMV